MSKLKITEFGNPILRKVSKKVTQIEIKSAKVQKLIEDMKMTIKTGEYGVGLAAPQVGESLAISVITLRPTTSHPERETFDAVIINPEITETVGEKVDKWEGCMSFGSGEPVFAQTRRYETIKVCYYDETAKLHEETLTGLKAHVFQHESDHLDGVLFVDRVEDPRSWMNASEYKKMLAKDIEKTKS